MRLNSGSHVTLEGREQQNQYSAVAAPSSFHAFFFFLHERRVEVVMIAQGEGLVVLP
jgi:hypothetical protein